MERIGIDNTADIEAEKAQRKEITCLKLPTKLVTELTLTMKCSHPSFNGL